MIFDGHGDIWTHVSRRRKQGEENILKNQHLDRFKAGGLIGGIFVVFANSSDDRDTRQETLEIISHMSTEIIKNQDVLRIVKAPGDFQRALDEGKLAVVLGLEGLSGLGDKVELINTLYLLGVRHASLTWNEENPLATGVKGNPDRGLSDKGRQAVKLMEDLGMLIDTAHANDRTFWDILDNTSGIIIDSHSNARALCDEPRNLSDDQVRAIVERKGLIGLNSYHAFVHKDQEKRDIHHFINHLDYLVDLAGIDHVAFGFDFFHYLSKGPEDNYDYAVKGLQSMLDVPKLIDMLGDKGYSQEDIDKISYKNFYRVIEAVFKAGP